MKKVLPAVILFIFILLAFIMVISYNERKPELRLTYLSKTYQLNKYPFSWNRFLFDDQKDYAIPPVIAEDMSAITVSPKGMLDFSFSIEPSYFDVTVWDNAAENYESTKDGITAPSERGTYVFAVIGHWSRGQILYVFKINVE